MEINLEKFGFENSIHGKMMFPRNDAVIGVCLREFGEFSENENILLSKFINNKDTIIDVGANIGTQTLSFSEKVGNKGKVLAFEPQSHIAQCLNTNLTLNGINNVIVDNAAISKKCGWAKINDKEFEESGRYGEAGISKEGTTKIRTINLDEIDLDSCSLIKIDIEGHEWDAIQGGESFLKKHKPVLYIEAKKDEEGTKKFIKWFFDNGWVCYWHYAFWYRKNNYRNNNNIKPIRDPGIGDMNIVAVPENNKQPTNLLKLKSFNEDWNEKDLKEFYDLNKLAMI